MAEKYLRRRRSGAYFVQIQVPKDLVEHPNFQGQRYVEQYLRTSSPSEARRLKHGVVAEILDRFERARERAPLSPDEVAGEGAAELHRWYDRLAADPLRAPDDLVTALSAIEEPDGSGLDYDMLRPAAERIVEKIGAEQSEASVSALAEELGNAAMTALSMWQKNIQPPPMVQGRPVARRRQGAAPTISEAAERYLTERQRDETARLTGQTVAQLRATFRLFGDYAPDAPLDAIVRDDAVGFLDTIAGLHPHYGRRPGAAKLSLQELLEKFSASDGNGLSNKTLNRHQSALKTLFRWARKRGMVEGENPFADLARPKGSNPYLPFKVEELNALFDGTTFDTKPKRHTLAATWAWLMAVALFSGMRQGEICELDTADVRCRDGVHYFDVTEAKSEAGVRRIPVHSELVRLGFLTYVKTIGEGSLWPALRPGGWDGKRAHAVAQRFPAYRRPRGVDRARVAFHSFRKNFTRALEIAKVDRDRAALVVGHERGFTYRVYNPEGLDVAMLREVVEAVRYEGLSLAGI